LLGISGTEALPFKQKHPTMEVTMFYGLRGRGSIYQALCCGATGYMTKATLTNSNGVLEVARVVRSMSCDVSRKVLCTRPTPTTHSGFAHSARTVVPQGIVGRLKTRRFPRASIYRPSPIRTHEARYRKMQVNSRTQLLSQHMRGLV
jgi:DNA-binding NarL/FixJ family response regulator